MFEQALRSDYESTLRSLLLHLLKKGTAGASRGEQARELELGGKFIRIITCCISNSTYVFALIAAGLCS